MERCATVHSVFWDIDLSTFMFFKAVWLMEGAPAATVFQLLKSKRMLSVGCRQGGGPNRQAADQNVMQVGMDAIFKLGSDAVGRNVHVFLSEHGSWYNARVKQCLPRQSTIHVQYESGDKDVLKGKEQGNRFNIRLMPISARTTA